MDTQWAAPILRTAFPGKPILAHFTLRAEEERDTAAAAQLLATLAGAGYTVTEAQAEELLGFPVTYHAPAAPQPFTNTDPEPPTDPTDPTDPAPLTNTTDPAPLTNTTDPAPLTNTTDPAPDPAPAEASYAKHKKEAAHQKAPPEDHKTPTNYPPTHPRTKSSK